MTFAKRAWAPAGKFAAGLFACLLCYGFVSPSAADDGRTSETSRHDGDQQRGTAVFEDASAETPWLQSSSSQVDAPRFAPRGETRSWEQWLPDYSARVRAGTSYFNLPSDSRVGGTYGLDIAVPFGDRPWGGYGGFSFNHFSGGTQFLGTVGLYRQADAQSSRPIDRVSLAVLFDQFTDTRFDNLYLSQLRLSLSYLLPRDWAVGVLYTEPIADDRQELFFSPSLTTQIRLNRSVSAFISTHFRRVLVTGLVGYRDPDSLILGTRIRVPLSDRLTTYAAAGYDDQGLWSTTVGLEWRFGRSRGHSDDGALARKLRTLGSLVRSQSPEITTPALWNRPSFSGLFGFAAVPQLPPPPQNAALAAGAVRTGTVAGTAVLAEGTAAAGSTTPIESVLVSLPTTPPPGGVSRADCPDPAGGCLIFNHSN